MSRARPDCASPVLFRQVVDVPRYVGVPYNFKPTLSDIILTRHPGGFMVNKPLKRRHGDAGGSEFAASSRVSPACANGGKRP